MTSSKLVMALTVAAAHAAAAMALPSVTVAQSADVAYERVAKAWATTKSLDANFEQKITNSVIGKTATSRGRFQQQRPGKVSITFTDPAGDRIVDDGSSLWVYLPSSAPGQVLKLPATADGAIVADLLGQLLETPKKAFTISGGESLTIDGRSTKRVQLVPKQTGTVPFSRAVLWLDDKEPRPVRVQVIDGQGIDRTITLTSWTPDAVLAKDAFSFKVPKGVKVTTKLPGA
jgi:outer membrane lipoprotein carrier protein